MGLEAAGAVAACIMLFAMAARGAGGTVRTLSGMFRAPDLGWPSGVQEDDDIHWTWSAASQGLDMTHRTTSEPELMDLEPAAVGLVLQPLHRGAHR